MTATELGQRLAHDAERVAAHLLPGGKRHGHEWVAGSTAGDSGQSLKVIVEGNKAGMWIDFAGAEHDRGDLIGLWKAARGVDLKTACAEAKEWLGVEPDYCAPTPTRLPTREVSEAWAELQTRLRKGTPDELDALAQLRGLPSIGGLELATAANQLWFADVRDDGFDCPCWILTDDTRLNAQARKMDGSLWADLKDKKCKTIKGCMASWPVGLHGINGKDIAMVEGSPDHLAAWHYIWSAKAQDRITPVSMLGASMNLPEETRPLFNKKRVFAFPHNDEAGAEAMAKWESQAGVPFIRFDLKPHAKKDLNELVAVMPEPPADLFSAPDLRLQKKLDLLAHRVRASAPPPEPITRLYLANKPICTAGNITTLTSKAKTGKTAALGAATAAIISASAGTASLDHDTFKFRAANPQGHAVIVFDTEQSPFDAYQCYRRSLERAGQKDDPAWLHHYSLVGQNARQLHESLDLAIEIALETHQGIFALILDGVADFVNSVNDEAESNQFVTWLRDRTVKNNCPAICVIHSNEGDKAGNDSRGHLGKQLIRKAESNLLLKKTNEITTITSDRQRGAPITEADQVAFQWDDTQKRHISCAPSGAGQKTGRPTKYQFADIAQVFAKAPDKGLTRNAAYRFATELCSVKETAFREILLKAVRDGELIATQESGMFYYRLPTLATP
jgi:hypothetical protein